MPVAAAGAAAGPLLVAAAGVLGSVGANVLTDVIADVVDRLRVDDEEPDPSQLRLSLAARIEHAFAHQDEQSQQIRTASAALLHRLDAVGVAVRTAVEVGDQDLRDVLATSFAALGSEFDEFGFVLADVRRSVWAIEGTVRGLEARSRAERERSRELAVSLRLVLDKVETVEARIRSTVDAGTGTASRWPGCPYLGLSPFEERHADVFYGRRELTAQLLQRLAERLTGAGLLVVLGASGAGKSSLLRAGLIPQLAAGRLVPGAAAWPRRVFTPTATPLAELAVQLAELGGLEAQSVHRSLTADPAGAALIAYQVLHSIAGGTTADDDHAGARLVLIVDQFEELFTLIGEETADRRAEREAFITALHAMATRPAGAAGSPPALVVIGVRADFLDQTTRYPQLRAAVQQGPFTVGPMSEAELDAAITGPGTEAGLTVDAELVEVVLADLRGSAGSEVEVGVLPLLSQAMLVTWEHREDERLTVHGYRRAGGVANAVQTSAEDAFQQLNEAQRGVAQAVFTQLTDLTRDGRLVRGRMSRAALHETCGSPALVDAVLEVFTAKRLLIAADSGVQITHDALLTAWSRLQGWLDADRADRALHHELRTDADNWDQHGRDPSFLYRGAQLTTVAAAVARWTADPARYPRLAPTTLDFLAAAHRTSSRGDRLRRAAAAGLALLTVAAVVSTIVAVGSTRAASRNADDARRQHDLALSRQLAAQSRTLTDTDPVTARRLAASAWRIANTSEAWASMTTLLDQQRGTLLGHTARVYQVAFSPDGKLLATTSADKTVRLWNPATGAPVGAPLTGHDDEVYGVAFSPDGKLLATTSDDKTVRLWNPATGAPVGAPLTGHTDEVYGVAFSPDGKLLATSSADETVRLWNPATGAPAGAPLTDHSDTVWAVAFSPDGKLLASASEDRTVRLWNSATGAPVGAPLTGHTDEVYGVAFSPDGKLLASASADETVRRWNPRTRAQVGDPLNLHDDTVVDVAFSPDGKLLASASADESARLWDPATGDPVGIALTGHGSSVSDVAFSPDGAVLATAGSDDTIRLWNRANGAAVSDPLSEHSGEVYAASFAPDGKTLATAANDETVRLWDPFTGSPIGAPLTGHTSTVADLAFSPDGALLASASADNTVRLWNPATRRPAGTAMKGHTDSVWGVAFSPDGKLLATAGEDATVRLWNPATRTQVGAPLVGHTDTVWAVAFSPDGKLLASVGGDKTVRLWNPATGAPIGAGLTGHTDIVYDVAFSPDGKLLASVGADQTVRLWDPAARAPIGAPLTGHTGTVGTVAFSPDATVLATGSHDDTVRLWNPVTGAPIGGPLTGHTDTVWGLAFSPDGTLLATTSSDETVRLWNPAHHRAPYAALCAQFGAPTDAEWSAYAPGETKAAVC